MSKEFNFTEEQLREYKEAFDLFVSQDNEDNKEGQEGEDEEPSITLDKLGGIMRSLFQYPTETELKDMVREVDEDGNGEIEFDEFLQLMGSKANELDSFEEMKEAFKIFDQDGDDIIRKEELQKVFQHIGCTLTLEECDLMIKEVDRTGKGEGIEFEDFVKLMKTSRVDLESTNQNAYHSLLCKRMLSYCLK
ncbi:hypothetical protein ABK040_004216 [Willaertia magna]